MSHYGRGRDVVIRYQGRLFVSDVDNLKNQIHEESHGSRYSIHLGATKMYPDLKEVYWWDVLKRDIIKFLAKSPNFQQVKAKHLKPGGLSQIMDVPTWKWESSIWTFLLGYLEPGGKIITYRLFWIG